MSETGELSHWLAELVGAASGLETFQDLTDLLLRHAREHLDLSTVWLSLRVPGDEDHLHLAAVSGTAADHARASFPVVPIAGDPLLEALARGEGPFLFEDLQTEPGLSREIIEGLGIRTQISAPLIAVDDGVGIIGAGTFGDEGTRALGDGQIERWMIVVAVASTVVARIRLREQDTARQRLEQRLAGRQRLESLGLLAGGVAHDLNNLLMVLHASLEFIAEGGLSAEQRADASVAESALASAADLTKQLLALGRRTPLKLAMIELGDVVGRTRRLLARVLPSTIEIEYVPFAHRLVVHADRAAVEQVVLNMALNARDAMPDGGRLSIELEQVVINGEYRRAHPWARPGRYALLTVTDTGTGMTDEVREQIFDPFFTTKAPDRGSGLGLAVVYGMVRQHNGMLHCYSEPGIGTTFKVYLPVAERDAGQVGSKLVGPVPKGTERVLVVDDDPGVRRVIERVLRRAGYGVASAGDGQEALGMLAQEGFDLFIVDAVMPRLDGRATIERILLQNPTARIIVASGYGSEALPAAFLSDLGLPSLPKPFAPELLLRTVRAALDGP